jgi:hypothetical protein
MRAVDRAPKRRLLCFGAGHGHREIGERGAGAFDRMQVDAATLDATLQHAVAHARARKLHDHVGRSEQQRQPHQRVVQPGRSPRPAAPRPADWWITHGAVDMPDWFADRHRTPAR